MAPKKDFMQRARELVEEATSEEPAKTADESVTAKRARKAGKVGGPARAKALSAEKRSEIARRAARARWEKSPDK